MRFVIILIVAVGALAMVFNTATAAPLETQESKLQLPFSVDAGLASFQLQQCVGNGQRCSTDGSTNCCSRFCLYHPGDNVGRCESR